MAVKENITRRRVMAGLATTPLLAAPADAAEMPSPLRSMYHAWQATKDAFNAHAEADGDEEVEATIFNEMLRLEDAAADFTPHTMEDLAFKIIFADDNGDMTMNIHQQALVKRAYAMVGIRPRLRLGAFGLAYEEQA